jgi:hypothetical protein
MKADQRSLTKMNYSSTEVRWKVWMVLALYCDIFKSKSEEIESKNTRVSKLIIKNKNLLETLEYFSNTQEKPKKCLNHVRG